MEKKGGRKRKGGERDKLVAFSPRFSLLHCRRESGGGGGGAQTTTATGGGEQGGVDFLALLIFFAAAVSYTGRDGGKGGEGRFRKIMAASRQKRDMRRKESGMARSFCCRGGSDEVSRRGKLNLPSSYTHSRPSPSPGLAVGGSFFVSCSEPFVSRL